MIKRSLATGLLLVLLTLCLAAAAFAVPGTPDLQATNLEMSLQPPPELIIPDGSNDTKDGPKVPGEDADYITDQILTGQAVSEENPEQPAGLPEGFPVLGAETVSLTAEEQQMLELVNRERASGGVGQLASDSSLVKLARLKAQDMVDNRYFDHNSPTYGSPFDMMKRFGISYSFAGENLAMAASVPGAHRALMESPGHRANIMKGNFDRVGIGIVVSGGYRYCVQMFTGGQRETTPTTPTPSTPGNSSGQQPQQPGQTGGGAADLSSEEALLFQLINQERSKYGLPKLSADSKLFQVARLKARDIVENNYFSHTSPTYGSVKEMLSRFGAQYGSASENLALTYNAARAHNALMNSSGNKANILSTRFTRVGIGVAAKGSYRYYVQIFTDGGAAQPPSGGTQPPSGGTTNPPSTGGGTGQDGSDPGTAGLTADEQRMLNLVNAERAKYGLSPLKANLKLTGVARLKARDMIDKNYFSHTSPTYGSPFDMMRQYGITYRTAGENLAGAPGVDTAHTNLMNSPGHRANILNGNFKEVGIGVLSGSPYGKIFVQMFIG